MKDGQLLISVGLGDLFGPADRKRLTSGFSTRVLIRVALQEAGGDEDVVSLAVQRAEIVYDIWDEKFSVRITRGLGAELRAIVATADDAIWRATALWQVPLADARRLRPNVRYIVMARGDLNPISEDLLADVRRWLVQPAHGQRKLGAGDSFFGSFVSIFVNPRIEDSERQLRFTSQPFVLPPAPPRAACAAAGDPATARRPRRRGRKGQAMKLRLPGRFEWKILGAMFIVAVLPLGAAAYSVRATLTRVQILTEQHQESVHGSLSGALEVYRSYFTEMKDNFRDRAAEIAAAPFTRASDLADVPDLLRARIIVGSEVVDEWEQPAEVQQRAQAAPPSLAAMPVGSGGGEPRLLELTFGISREIYSSHQALLEAAEREQGMDRVLPVILKRYFGGVLLALVVVLGVAAVLGMLVARAATGRVATLRDAARRVGEGDLDVRVAPRGSDELDELGRAFDRMVAELGDARSRLGYLQKVSAWQEVARRLAHEIKNPLTPIQLAVQELVSKYAGGDPTYTAAAGDGAGDHERGGRLDPPPGRRLLRVRQARPRWSRRRWTWRRSSRTSRVPTRSGRRGSSWRPMITSARCATA